LMLPRNKRREPRVSINHRARRLVKHPRNISTTKLLIWVRGYKLKLIASQKSNSSRTTHKD
jgi:hypothetical protein